ncbi:MAG: N-acetyltransferase family protein [Bacillota bacterium]
MTGWTGADQAGRRPFWPEVFEARDGRMVAIRPVTLDDAAESVAIVRQAAEEGIYLLVEPEMVRTAEEQREYLRQLHPDDLFLVTEVDGHVVGQVDAYRGRWGKIRHTADIGLVIAQDYRNLGIGRRLLQAVDRWARESGLLKLSLGVFSSNDRAIHLYRGCGFQVEGVRSRHLYVHGQFVDELIMAKFLEPDEAPPGNGQTTQP